jgi:hypothetical protein
MLVAVTFGILFLVLAAGSFILWRRWRTNPPPARVKRQQVLPGGGPVPEDLAKDAYTDDQRFLM